MDKGSDVGRVADNGNGLTMNCIVITRTTLGGVRMNNRRKVSTDDTYPTKYAEYEDMFDPTARPGDSVSGATRHLAGSQRRP